MTRQKTDRFLELDCLRGIAAFSVLFGHYTIFAKKDYYFPIGPLEKFQGHWAVWLFFVISGFVIFMTLEKTKRPLDFVVSRFSRLYPSYWTGILFTFTLASLLQLPSYNVTPGDAAINLTMLQAWFGVEDVDGSYWTLAAELSFYTAMLLLFATGLLRHIRVVGCVWLVAVWAHALLEWRGLLPQAVPVSMRETIRITFLLRLFPLFFAGILFYQLRTGRATRWDHLLLPFCFFTYEVVVCLIPEWGWLDRAMVVVIGAIGYLFSYGLLGWLVLRPLVFLGWISYPLYLIHATAGHAILRQLHETLGLNVLLAMILTTGLIVLVATAISYFVEQPALRRIRKWYTAAKTPPPARAPEPAPVPTPLTSEARS